MPRLRVYEKANDVGALKLALEPWDPPKPHAGEVVVEIHAAGVNPSDVKATLGAMSHAVWPRTPGRDWAGIVTDGPSELKGRAVWGSGGELGIRRDGSHASHLVLEAAKVRLKPESISLREAGAVGVPFVTAYEGLRSAGLPAIGDTVLVLGANGKVGQAAIQISTMLGARVFGVERNSGTFAGHASSPVRTIDGGKDDLAKIVRDETDGHGADIVFNTVGSPYFEKGNAAMALRGRQVFIATIERSVPFDILDFYRGQRTYVGVDTLALDGRASAEILDKLTPGFESGALRPFPVLDDAVYPLEDAKEAYRAVLSGSRHRVILTP